MVCFVDMASECPHLPKSYASAVTTPLSPIATIPESSSTWSVPSEAEKEDQSSETYSGPSNFVPTENKPVQQNGYLKNSNKYFHTNNNNNNSSAKMTRSTSGTSFKFPKLSQSFSYPLGFLTEMLHPTPSSSMNSL